MNYISKHFIFLPGFLQNSLLSENTIRTYGLQKKAGAGGRTLQGHDEILDRALLKGPHDVSDVIDDQPGGALNVGGVVAQDITVENEAASSEDLVVESDDFP